MKKIAKLLAYTLVALMLAGGLAGSAAAAPGGSFNDNQVQYSDQHAYSHVHQGQGVYQENNNYGGAVAGAYHGHASAWNINAQSNSNSQWAYSNAQNANYQSQYD